MTDPMDSSNVHRSRTEDELVAVRGIVMAAVLSLPFWAVAGAAVYWWVKR